MTVDAPAKALELSGAQGHARRDQPFALRLAPVFEYGRSSGHGDLSLMFSRELRNLAAALALAAPLAGWAAPGDEAVVGAYDAYRAGDALKLARYASKLEGHPLDPWIDYWSIALRLPFERGQITAAKTTLGYLEKADAPDERMLVDAARQPKRLLERLPRNLERRAVREVVVLALLRYARAEPEGAAKLLEGRLAS